MKKTLLILLFLTILLPNYASAKAAFLSLGDEDIIKLIDLPNDKRFEASEGEYIDIAYIYKSISLLYIPLWNYDGRLIGITGQQDSYLDLQPDQIIELLAEAKSALPEPPYLDAWQTIGGKFLFILIASIITISVRVKANKKSAYLSVLPEAHDRLKDIVLNGQKFTEIDQGLIDKDGKLGLLGLSFLAVKNYKSSFITISIIDMNKVTVEQVDLMNDEFFERLLPLKKIMREKSLTTIHCIYYIFDISPRADDIRLIKKLNKRKIMESTVSVSVIVDLEKQIIHAKSGMYPSKKILKKCFIQAGDFEDATRETSVLNGDIQDDDK